jgi:flavin reductase (DIM6/NTAB) family NADH-FMN oxidoreductase RutF
MIGDLTFLLGDFTVNVPKKGMEEIVSYCGTYSGRENDKAKEKGLNLTPSKKVKSPIIKDCIIHYECKVKFKAKVNSKELPKKIKWRYYPKSDDHTLYFGEILFTSSEKDIDFD